MQLLTPTCGYVFLRVGFTYDGCTYGKLNKAIPGVKQGAFLWWVKFKDTLIDAGFEIQTVEPCLFIFWKNNVTCILLIHTDNIMVSSNDFSWWEATHSKWDFLTERVDSVSILGLQIERTGPHSCTFCQPQYIDDLIKEFDLVDSPIKNVPIRHGIENDYDPDNMSRNIDTTIPYRSLCMKLYWVARSFRGHIMYACNFFARFSHCYTKELFDEMKNVVLYLKGTKSWKLCYEMDPSLPLDVVFGCDANYSNTTGHKSSFGCLGWIQSCLVYAQSSTINIQVTSSCESESHAIFEACKAAIYIKNWINCFSPCKLPIFVFNDNTSAIAILGVRSNGTLSKHFAPRLRYVTELVELGFIKLFHIPGGMNGADILTHSLGRVNYQNNLYVVYGKDGLQGLYDVAAAREGGELRLTKNPYSGLTRLVL
jgi:hypothetical protein